MQTIRSENALSALRATSRSFPSFLDAALEVYMSTFGQPRRVTTLDLCLKRIFFFIFQYRVNGEFEFLNKKRLQFSGSVKSETSKSNGIFGSDDAASWGREFVV